MDKKKKILIVVITILIITIGVTFAYFMAKTGDGVSKNLNVTSDTVDDLKFSVSKDLSLSINQFNFGEGAGNLSDDVVARASLKANSTKKTATYNYYVYFQIESNGFIYTTTGKLPEVVLSITGPNGEVTSIDGLTFVSATSADGTVVKGFDITELGNSVIKIADNYEITSSSSTNYTNQDWTFKVTFINLSTNQLGNDGKSLVGKVLIQKENIILFNDYIVSQYTGTQGENGLYYHDTSLENGAGDNSYRYAGASDVVNNYVCFGTDETTCPVDNLYRIIGVFDGRVKLIKADYATTSLLGSDGDYTGFNAYSDSTSEYKGELTISDIGGYSWNKNAYGYSLNTWDSSLLNKTNLNTNYLNNIGSKWSNMLDVAEWKYGGNIWTKIGQAIPSTLYQNELINPSSDGKVNTKVGLMYISDYAYSASPDAWQTYLYNYSDSVASSNNWLYYGLSEWTMSARSHDPSSDSGVVYYIYFNGRLSNRTADISFAIRPCFYFKKSVSYLNGDGTKSSPYRIEV